MKKKRENKNAKIRSFKKKMSIEHIYNMQINEIVLSVIQFEIEPFSNVSIFSLF